MPHEVRVVPPVEGDLRRLAACHYDVWLDGRRVHPSNVTIELDATGVPRVVLDFPYVTVSSFEGTAEVVLSPGLEDALIGLGWTPPAPGLPTERVPDDALISDDHAHGCGLRRGGIACSCGADETDR